MIQSDQKEEVIQTLWTSGNSIDYLIMLTNLSIRTFEI